GRRAVLVTIFKVTFFDHRNSHRAEITDSGCKEIPIGMVFRRQRPAFYLERDAPVVATERQWKYRAGGLHARCRFETALQVDEEPRLGILFVFNVRKRHGERENILRMQTAVDVLQAPETLNQQARTDQQHDRDGELSHREHTAHAVAPYACACAASTLFQ